MLVQGCGLVVLVQGACERLLEAEGFLDSFSLHAQVRGAVGRVVGPRVLASGRRVDVEVVEALRELRRLKLAEGLAERGMAQGSPLRR